jgi:TolB-like protein/tetratricopeptide (TPR) repeat protein
LENPSEQEIRAELERILQSAIFLQSDRLGRFLRFAIENAVAGNTGVLKEYVIGTEVYDRKPPYHPSQDSIVRTEARRLRAKLKEYYESEGRQNPVFIYFRPGTYVPLFRRNTALPPSFNGAALEEDLLTKGAGVAVAVLPFLDLSNRPLSASCAQGITDEVTHHLTRAEGIRVIARAFQPSSYGAPYDIPSLSQNFGINTFIDGTVREDFNRLLITARVLGADGFQLSSHRFETAANPEVLAQVQEQVATAFVNRARPQMSSVRHRKASPGALTLAAYPLVMHAETLLDEGSGFDLPAALSKFQEAKELAPSYARTYCGISHCHSEIALRGASPSSSYALNAKEAALRAMELDPGMIESYSCLGTAQALQWDWENAETSFLRGLALGMQVGAARRYGLFLAILGRFEEAAHYLDAAQSIDPFSNRQKVARTKLLHVTRRFSEGLQQLSEPLIYGPLPPEVRFLLALMCAHVGERDRAVRLIEGIRPAMGGQLPMMAGIAEVLALSGEMDQARRIAEGFKLLSPDTAISRFRQALLALALGDTERALSLLALATEDREAELIWIGVDPRLDPIRSTTAFREIARSVLPGLADPSHTEL